MIKEKHPDPDPDLLQGLLNKEVRAYNTFYIKHMSMLRRQISGGFKLPMQDAKDIAQDAFLRLWEKADLASCEFDDVNDVKAYLYIIARNEAIRWINRNRKRLKRQHKFAMLSDVEWSNYVWQTEARAQLESHKKELYEAISKLTAKQVREILILNLIHEMDRQEISLILNTSPNNVTNQLNKGYKLLRPFLSKKSLQYYTGFLLYAIIRFCWDHLKEFLTP